MASGIIGFIDFEDYNVAELDGQGTSPFVWSEMDGGGARPGAGNRWDVLTDGGASGLVARRFTTTTVGNDAVAQIILQSGITTADFDKIAYEFDIYSEHDGSRHDMFLYVRPSGVVWNNNRTVKIGYIQNVDSMNNSILLSITEDGSSILSDSYLVPQSAFTNDIQFRFIDDLENGKLINWVNTSGSWELTHEVDADRFIDHESSGGGYARNVGGTQIVMLNNLRIIGFGDQFPTDVALEKGVGESIYSRHYGGVRSARRAKMVQMF